MFCHCGKEHRCCFVNWTSIVAPTIGLLLRGACTVDAIFFCGNESTTTIILKDKKHKGTNKMAAVVLARSVVVLECFHLKMHVFTVPTSGKRNHLGGNNNNNNCLLHQASRQQSVKFAVHNVLSLSNCLHTNATQKKHTTP